LLVEQRSLESNRATPLASGEIGSHLHRWFNCVARRKTGCTSCMSTFEVKMIPTRRHFLKSAAAAGTLSAVPTASVSAKNGALRADDISALFAQLPGDVAFKILAPNAKGKKAFVAQRNSDRMLFVASAIKTFVLCEALRQVDSENVV